MWSSATLGYRSYSGMHTNIPPYLMEAVMLLLPKQIIIETERLYFCLCHPDRVCGYTLKYLAKAKPQVCCSTVSNKDKCLYFVFLESPKSTHCKQQYQNQTTPKSLK